MLREEVIIKLWMKQMLQIHSKVCTHKPLAEDHRKNNKKVDIILQRSKNINQEMLMKIGDQRKCETYHFSNLSNILFRV